MRPASPRAATETDRTGAARRLALSFTVAAALAATGCTFGPPSPESAGLSGGQIYSGIKLDGQKGEKTPPPVTALPPKPAEPAIDSDPKRLIGLDRGALTGLLGAPAFRRSDAPAEFWRYRGESCDLDVFLYGPEKPAEADKRVLVRHVEARPVGDGGVTADECLRTLLRARLARGTS